MSLIRLVHRLILLGAILGLAGMVIAGSPERKTFQFGEFTIEASTGDEAYVEALAVQLVEFKLPKSESPVQPKLSLEDLAKRRDYFLGKIAGMLGMPQATKKMGETFDAVLLDEQNRRGSLIQDVPRRYAVWRGAEVSARLDKGETVTGFSRDQTGELTLDFSFLFDLGPDAAVNPARIRSQMMKAWDELPWTVYIAPKPNQSPVTEVAHDLEQLGQVANATGRLYVQVMLQGSACKALRQTTATGVMTFFPSSVNQRWFYDGVANHVAMKLLEAEVGRTEAKGYYDLAAELSKFAPMALQIDLMNWPVAEDQERLKFPVEQEASNYAFATKVMADVCAKQGDSFLPKLFAEIGRTPPEKATIETVFKAFKRLTKEDLRSYLPKPADKR